MASAITDPSAPPALSVHPADPAFPGPRPAVLVLPGGGYREHTEHDGEGYARWLSRLALLPEAAVAALLGDLAHLADELSPARHLHGSVGPAFVWATAQDGPGLPNALAWTQALADAGARVELHVYPKGGHGVGLADGVRYGEHGAARLPRTAQWTADCERWMRAEGLL